MRPCRHSPRSLVANESRPTQESVRTRVRCADFVHHKGTKAQSLRHDSRRRSANSRFPRPRHIDECVRTGLRGPVFVLPLVPSCLLGEPPRSFVSRPAVFDLGRWTSDLGLPGCSRPVLSPRTSASADGLRRVSVEPERAGLRRAPSSRVSVKIPGTRSMKQRVPSRMALT
jgi:hypothetical protein